jgi:hypothetical protein
MEKRYQVFLSSTYADLREERQRVIQTLMEMDCIPSGMELFPAADEEQWEFIKKVIDDCDYYLLIIGGRYGSITSEGISYTEKEYDYAISRGIKVIALLHASPSEIPIGKSETNPELRDRLSAFRDKVAQNRLVKFWSNAEQLPGLVALSLSKTVKMHPAVGWVRGNQISNVELLNEVNELRKKKDELEKELVMLRADQSIAALDLAPLDDSVRIFGEYRISATTHSKSRNGGWEIETTWKEVFCLSAPYLLDHPNDFRAKEAIAKALFAESKRDGFSPSIDDQLFQTIKIQLIAQNLVKVQLLQTVQGGMALFWSLTPNGQSLMMSLRSVRSAKDTDSLASKS